MSTSALPSNEKSTSGDSPGLLPTPEVRPTDESLRLEYEDIGYNMRNLWNLRFAKLTVFASINAGCLLIVFGKDAPTAATTALLPTILVLVGGAFFLMDCRIRLYYSAL